MELYYYYYSMSESYGKLICWGIESSNGRYDGVRIASWRRIFVWIQSIRSHWVIFIRLSHRECFITTTPEILRWFINETTNEMLLSVSSGQCGYCTSNEPLKISIFHFNGIYLKELWPKTCRNIRKSIHSPILGTVINHKHVFFAWWRM